jgi:ribokinase
VPRIVVVGFAFGVPTRPGPGEVVLATRFGQFRGGKGFNQAVAAARLGAEVVMVGAVGDDDFGRGFLRAFEAEGVDASRVAVIADEATAVAVPMITPDGDVGFVQHQGANRRVAAEAAGDLPACDALLLQGEVPAAPPPATARLVAGRGGRVVLNPAPVHDITPALAEAATVITPNEVEAAALLGMGAGAADGGALDGEAAARALVTATRHGIVTLGARGAAWADGTRSGTVAPPRVEAVDATAAGDSFTAALAVALCEGADYSQALAFATAAGAHAATIRGAEPALPRRSDVERLLAGR